MTQKERILNTLRGKEVDRIPWSPFLEYWWQSQSQEFQNRGMRKFYEQIGADYMHRGSHILYDTKIKNCNFREIKKSNERMLKYETPVGDINGRQVFVEESNTWFLVDHFLKTKEDYKVLTYLNENMEVFENGIEEFNKEVKDLGNEGLYIPVIGTNYKTSFQSLLEHWAGTQELVYALMDFPEIIDNCIQTMRSKAIKSVEISVDSLADAFIFWEDTSTTNISPDMFEKYVSPEINAWADVIHKSNKMVIHHACGHLKHLMPYIAKTNIDMIESITPPPTGDIEIPDVRTSLPNKISIAGGIDPTKLLYSSMEELEEIVIDLIKQMRGTPYILANSDSCPPGVEIDKFKRISELVKEYS